MQTRSTMAACVPGFVFLLPAPSVFYPVPRMKILCFGLFAAAFNLLLGYAGLLSLGHAHRTVGEKIL